MGSVSGGALGLRGEMGRPRTRRLLVEDEEAKADRSDEGGGGGGVENLRGPAASGAGMERAESSDLRHGASEKGCWAWEVDAPPSEEIKWGR